MIYGIVILTMLALFGVGAYIDLIVWFRHRRKLKRESLRQPSQLISASFLLRQMAEIGRRAPFHC